VAQAGAAAVKRAQAAERARNGLGLNSGGRVPEAVAELEAELYKGNWLSRNQETHRLAIARVIGRIGTPQARLVLERGAQSKRVLVRKACEDALGGMRDAA